MSKILVIEDDQLVRDSTLDLLQVEGFETCVAEHGRRGLELARQELPDLIICDIMMPEMDGYAVLDHLRNDVVTAAIPFIFLTAKASKSEMREGMELGADDYLTKPFGRLELLRAIGSRLKKQAALIESLKNQPKDLIFSSGSLTINFARRKVTLEGNEVKLTAHQYGLLEYLAQNAGRVITHRVALQTVWGPEYSDETQYLHVFVNQLRHKIEPDPGHPQYILTERGVGYRFRSPN